MRKAAAIALLCLVGISLLVGGLLAWVLDRGPGRTGVDVALDHSRARPQGGYYTLAVPEPSSLNPYTTVGNVARDAVLRYTHDALMEPDPGGAGLRPALAETVESFDGGRRLVFTIRAGVRFADGSPLTMADVLFTHELAKTPDLSLGAVGSALQLVAALRALDAHRLEIRLKSLTFASVDTVATGYIVGKKSHFLDAVARAARAEGLTMPAPNEPEFGRLLAAVQDSGPGTGPYRLARWDQNRGIDLQQNAHSWRRESRPLAWNLAGLRLRFVQDKAAQLALFRQGRLDLYQDHDVDALLAANPDLAVNGRSLTYDHRGLGHFAVIWNHRRPHLADRRVRRGLSLLFDRQRIVREVFAGKARVSRTWFRPGSPEDRAIPSAGPGFDPEAARVLFAEIGHEKLRVELLHAASQPQHRRIVELAQSAFSTAGVRLAAAAMDWTAMLARLRGRDFDGILLHVSLPPHVDPYREFHSSQVEGGRNWMGYASDEADALLAAARTEMDAEQRVDQWRRFHEIFVRDQPVTLLVHPLSSILLNRRFEGVELGVLGLYPELWWVTGSH